MVPWAIILLMMQQIHSHGQSHQRPLVPNHNKLTDQQVHHIAKSLVLHTLISLKVLETQELPVLVAHVVEGTEALIHARVSQFMVIAIRLMVTLSEQHTKGRQDKINKEFSPLKLTLPKRMS